MGNYFRTNSTYASITRFASAAFTSISLLFGAAAYGQPSEPPTPPSLEESVGAESGEDLPMPGLVMTGVHLLPAPNTDFSVINLSLEQTVVKDYAKKKDKFRGNIDLNGDKVNDTRLVINKTKSGFNIFLKDKKSEKKYEPLSVYTEDEGNKGIAIFGDPDKLYVVWEYETEGKKVEITSASIVKPLTIPDTVIEEKLAGLDLADYNTACGMQVDILLCVDVEQPDNRDEVIQEKIVAFYQETKETISSTEEGAYTEQQLLGHVDSMKVLVESKVMGEMNLVIETDQSGFIQQQHDDLVSWVKDNYGVKEEVVVARAEPEVSEPIPDLETTPGAMPDVDNAEKDLSLTMDPNYVEKSFYERNKPEILVGGIIGGVVAIGATVLGIVLGIDASKNGHTTNGGVTVTNDGRDKW